MELDIESIRALNQIADDRGIEMSLILSGLEAALAAAFKKYQSPNQNVEVKIDPENGEVTINELRTVVEDMQHLKNPDTEITLYDAKNMGFTKALPDDVIKIERNPKNFGRIAAQTARQVITQRLRDAERLMVFSEFADKVGEMITGTVFKPDGDQILIRLNERTDAVLPRKERIPGERYIPGMSMKFYILEVKQMSRGPRILVSRTHPGLLRRLMELEIPEIQQGVIEIKNVVRDGGARAKVALASLDPSVDPVGACVGNGGIRIKAVSTALRNEKVDIVVWDNDPTVYIRNALSPAQITKIEVDSNSEEPSVKAYVYPDQLSLAIGKAGQNVRLAAKLTGWKIDIKTIEPDRMPTLKDIFNEAMDDSEKIELKTTPKFKKSRSQSKSKAIREAINEQLEQEQAQEQENNLDDLDMLNKIDNFTFENTQQEDNTNLTDLIDLTDNSENNSGETNKSDEKDLLNIFEAKPQKKQEKQKQSPAITDLIDLSEITELPVLPKTDNTKSSDIFE